MGRIKGIGEAIERGLERVKLTKIRSVIDVQESEHGS